MAGMLNPTPSLLCKLASIAVHAEEFFSPDGHNADYVALQSGLSDPEVKAWVEQMAAASLAPRKRSSGTPSEGSEG